MIKFINIVDQFAHNSSNEIMNELINAAKNGINDQEIAYLANCMAQSGLIIGHTNKWNSADIASTGGPGSLSTIICPLFLRSLDYVIPKLGVPGRPAGGIDVLAQIPGYQYVLDQDKINDIINRSGYVHFLASNKFAPLDAIFFDFRKRHKALDIPALVIASLLCKKIALGVTVIGLDIRVAPHGNFGSSTEIARENARRFCRVADLLGSKAICFLTDNCIPPQPFIGRGESLLAISHIFRDCTSTWLRDHVDMCYAMSRRLAVYDSNHNHPSQPSHLEIKSSFIDNLKAQGTSLDAFDEYVGRIENGHIYELLSLEDGFVFVDLNKIREIITRFQSEAKDVDGRLFPDPCGVILKKRPGQYVLKGEQIASVRLPEKYGVNPKQEFGQAIRVLAEPQLGFLFEEVTYG